MNDSYSWLMSHMGVLVEYAREGERRGESTVAAVEEIIPGLGLSLSNRNSYNYCGSIRLKRQKSLQREGRECTSFTEVQ